MIGRSGVARCGVLTDVLEAETGSFHLCTRQQKAHPRASLTILPGSCPTNCGGIAQRYSARIAVFEEFTNSILQFCIRAEANRQIRLAEIQLLGVLYFGDMGAERRSS